MCVTCCYVYYEVYLSPPQAFMLPRSVFLLQSELKPTMAVAVNPPPQALLLSGSISTLRSKFKALWKAILEENLDSFRQQFRELSHETQIEIVQVCNERRTLLHTMGEPGMNSDQREELLWLLDIANRWTPLHYASRQQRADIVKQT